MRKPTVFEVANEFAEIGISIMEELDSKIDYKLNKTRLVEDTCKYTSKMMKGTVEHLKISNADRRLICSIIWYRLQAHLRHLITVETYTDGNGKICRNVIPRYITKEGKIKNDY